MIEKKVYQHHSFGLDQLPIHFPISAFSSGQCPGEILRFLLRNSTIGCGSSRGASAVAPRTELSASPTSVEGNKGSTASEPSSGGSKGPAGLGNSTLGRWLGGDVDGSSAAPALEQKVGAPVLNEEDGNQKGETDKNTNTGAANAAVGTQFQFQLTASGYAKATPQSSDGDGATTGATPTKLILSGGELVQVEAGMSESTPIYHSIFQLQNTTAPQEPRLVLPRLRLAFYFCSPSTSPSLRPAVSCNQFSLAHLAGQPCPSPSPPLLFGRHDARSAFSSSAPIAFPISLRPPMSAAP